ncbi:hypothetical protein OS493_033607 [Desmophyllum pertusum]|uniref:Uncharacterized protein n=1 Tax=Desmophyllum pertusum TaxID=174260 RepID=A0A9W9YVJ9_9CNID|nr:hypothetical protein OS493_033607 [Desmophyllum pertusum]
MNQQQLMDMTVVQDNDLPPSLRHCCQNCQHMRKLKGSKSNMMIWLKRNSLLIDGGIEVALGNDWLFVICFISE